MAPPYNGNIYSIIIRYRQINNIDPDSGEKFTLNFIIFHGHITTSNFLILNLAQLAPIVSEPANEPSIGIPVNEPYYFLTSPWSTESSDDASTTESTNGSIGNRVRFMVLDQMLHDGKIKISQLFP